MAAVTKTGNTGRGTDGGRWGEVQFGACGIVYFQKWVLGLGVSDLCLLSHGKQLELERGVFFPPFSLHPHALGCGADRMFRGYLSTCVYECVCGKSECARVCGAWLTTKHPHPGRVYRLTGLFVFVV